MKLLTKEDKKNLLIAVVGLPFYFLLKNYNKKGHWMRWCACSGNALRIIALEKHVTETDKRVNALYSWGGHIAQGTTPGDFYNQNWN